MTDPVTDILSTIDIILSALAVVLLAYAYYLAWKYRRRPHFEAHLDRMPVFYTKNGGKP